MYRSLTYLWLTVLGLLLGQLASCVPLGNGDDGLPISGPAAGGTSNNNSGGGTADPTRPGNTAVGGDSAGVQTIADELTVEFPGCREPVQAAFWRAEVLRLVNEERAKKKVPPVQRSATLEAQASQYACEMVYYGFFGHVNDFTGSTLAERAAEFEYDYWIIGENLAAGQRTPAQVVADWMGSPCHRQNILNPAFTELGVGIRYGGEYGFYWVQEFGRPFSEEPYPGPTYHDPECQQ